MPLRPLRAALIGALLLGAPPAAAGEAVRWLAPAAALASDAAAEAGPRKIFLTFVSKNCSACRRMDSETYTDADVAAYLNRHYRPARVDAARHREMAARYRVRAVPTHCFLQPDGKPVSCLPGAVPPADFLLILRYMQTDSYRTMSLKRFATEAGAGP